MTPKHWPLEATTAANDLRGGGLERRSPPTEKNWTSRGFLDLERDAGGLQCYRGRSLCNPQHIGEELAREVAVTECEPLASCGHCERSALKKKLLLKWHPDKQPSTEAILPF